MSKQNKQKISFNKKKNAEVYRSSAVASRPNRNEQLFGHAPFRKSDDKPLSLGDKPLDLFAVDKGPVIMQPLEKQPLQPTIEVVQPVKDELSEMKSDDVAPMYDGYQTLCAHHSQTKSPQEMSDIVNIVLLVLVEAQLVDFYQASTFVFQGRTFGPYQECEFQLSIFSHDSSESVLEMRRTTGGCFEYNGVESKVLQQLTERGALSTENGSESDQSMNDSDTFGSSFGLPALPSLDSMDDFISSEDDLSMGQVQSKESAVALVEHAVDLNAMKNELRADIATLNADLRKNGDLFASIPGIVSKIADAMTNESFYDAWAIKMYLEMTATLISSQSSVPPSLLQSVSSVKARWSSMVINEVAPGVSFKFYPSQQIVRSCEEILAQLK